METNFVCLTKLGFDFYCKNSSGLVALGDAVDRPFTPTVSRYSVWFPEQVICDLSPKERRTGTTRIWPFHVHKLMTIRRPGSEADFAVLR